MTKKYQQPQTQVTSIAILSSLLTGSAGDSMGISETETGTVW